MAFWFASVASEEIIQIMIIFLCTVEPAITKCHDTEKIVRYSGVFVTAKTPL